MHKKYIDEEHLQIAMTEYLNPSLNRIVTTPDGRSIGTVTQVYDDVKGTGEQVYAIVNDPKLKPSEVSEVTVLFRGSTGINQITEQPKDVFDDWVKNDLLIGLRVQAQEHPNYSKNVDRSTPQLKAAAEHLKTIMASYPNAKINIYGHSLGSMKAQYSIADLSQEDIYRIQYAYIYNAPNVYGILDDYQKETVDLIKGRIYNFVDPKDWISMVGRDMKKGSIDAVGQVYYVDSKDLGMSDQHMTYGYQLDKYGNIKLLSISSSSIFKKISKNMQNYYAKKAKFGSKASSLSANEKLYLDSEQASIIGKGLGETVQQIHDRIQSLKQISVQDSEKLWSETLQVPWGFSLTPAEVQSAYIEAGMTHLSIVENTRDYGDEIVENLLI
ncbi:Mbeg1-like protein [Streptococcus cuniculi]|uniref:DUF2974 domain-containing protein n=1 Tax=Streptococcus cuniculi TaxID=1432788 RepID=A0A4Y9JEY9_9STRE|nr:Mbeg1-like protein [Streptococcus cuniculi]MBF0777464.1 DUF2974 domain-containing protein [Streptococcus cuniculi]TFU98519.1 DUF2974 domain-containing protein [Streptococcus cuniculi]